MPRIRGNALGNIFSSTEVEEENFYGLRGDDMFLFNGDLTDSFFGGRGNDTFIWNTRRVYDGEHVASDFSFIEFSGGRGFDSMEFRLEVAPSVSSIDLAPFHARFIGAEAAEIDLTFQSSQSETSPRDFVVNGTKSADGISIRNFLGDNFTIATKAGRDTVSIVVSGQTEELTVNTGRGNDIVRNLAGVNGAQIFTGAGRDKVTVDGETSGFYNLGRGNDLVTFSYATRYAPDTIHTGSGRDVIEFTSYPTGSVSAHILDFNESRDRIRLDFDNFDGEIYFSWDSGEAKEGDAIVSISERGDAVLIDGVGFISFEQPVDLTEDNFLFV